jgi:hypothetical protein
MVFDAHAGAFALKPGHRYVARWLCPDAFGRSLSGHAAIAPGGLMGRECIPEWQWSFYAVGPNK